MALIKCSECGKKFSDKAETCPHCGCPISVQKPTPQKIKVPMDKSTKAIIIGSISIIVAIVIGIVVMIIVDAHQRKVNKEIADSIMYGDNGGINISDLADGFTDYFSSVAEY